MRRRRRGPTIPGRCGCTRDERTRAPCRTPPAVYLDLGRVRTPMCRHHAEKARNALTLGLGYNGLSKEEWRRQIVDAPRGSEWA